MWWLVRPNKGKGPPMPPHPALALAEPEARFIQKFYQICSPKERHFCGTIRLVKELHFKKIPGGTYQVLFYVGDFFVPVEEDLIQELKKQANHSPQEFLKLIIDKLGFTTYLKSAIQEVLNKSNDSAAQAKTLMTELQAL